MYVAGALPMAALLLSATSRQRADGRPAFSPAPVGRTRGLAYIIPDIPWYDSTAAGWAGTDPDTSMGLGHGVFEQVCHACVYAPAPPPRAPIAFPLARLPHALNTRGRAIRGRERTHTAALTTAATRQCLARYLSMGL